MSSHSLLKGFFPTQGSNPGLPHCRRILCLLSHQGRPYMMKGMTIRKWNKDGEKICTVSHLQSFNILNIKRILINRCKSERLLLKRVEWDAWDNIYVDRWLGLVLKVWVESWVCCSFLAFFTQPQTSVSVDGFYDELLHGGEIKRTGRGISKVIGTEPTWKVTSKFTHIMGSAEEPGAKEVLQVLCVFQTCEGLNYILCLWLSQTP